MHLQQMTVVPVATILCPFVVILVHTVWARVDSGESSGPGPLILATLDVASEDGKVRHIRLERQSINPSLITLSGFSSGATFAQQLQFSYSSLFSGIAVFSHSYYGCGPGDGILVNYDDVCTAVGHLPKRIWNPKLAVQLIHRYFKEGLIENPKNLKNKKLYVFAGTRNPFFTVDQSMSILNIYEPFIRNNAAIRTRVKQANLTLPSLRFGGPCIADSASSYYISSCDLSGPFESLHFLLPEHVSRAPLPHELIPIQPLRTFDQSEFFHGVKGEHDMDKLGYIYIPKNCHGQKRKCLLHIYFHGCSVGREFVGDHHIRSSGFLDVAEINNIIMIFPQVLSNKDQNPGGCWDVYGYTGPNFATKHGAQISVIRNILARVLGEDIEKEPPPEPNLGWSNNNNDNGQVGQGSQGQGDLNNYALVGYQYESSPAVLSNYAGPYYQNVYAH